MSLDGSVVAVIETLYAFLDRSPVAIVLLDGQKRVVFANEHAADLNARADGISICSSGIVLLRAHDHVRLQGLIARAACGSEVPARSMRALRSSGKRPYGFLVAPLSQRDRDRSHAAFRPAVCIVIADPDG